MGPNPDSPRDFRLRSTKNTRDYGIAWIAALHIEMAAAIALLDEEHTCPSDFRQHHSDDNSYSWGCISGHHVVIAALPAGVYGLTSATAVALGLVASLPHIKIGLLVGIGAGIPSETAKIRLGDIAVSQPQGTSGGVIQYDTGKATTQGWQRIGVSMMPPKVLLSALTSLKARHELENTKIPALLRAAAERHVHFAKNYGRPRSMKDALVAVKDAEAEQHADAETTPRIFYGNIASGNILIKSVIARRDILDSIGEDCICFEMEAAGLMKDFPCLVIRGICDYADSGKNDVWQRYSAATAAAFAKELLSFVARSEVEEITDIPQQIGKKVAQDEHEKRVSEFLQVLYVHDYTKAKDRNPRRIEGTCQWFVRHPVFTKWRDNQEAPLLWVTADPGCGKSVLARYLVDECLPNQNVFYFFFKDDFVDQKSVTNAACSILHQLLSANRSFVTQDLLQRVGAYGHKINESFTILWDLFLNVISAMNRQAVCIFDALDECREDDRIRLLDTISKYPRDIHGSYRLKCLLLGRPYFSIQRRFMHLSEKIPVLHLQGDNDHEREAISREIELVINHRINEFCRDHDLSGDDHAFLSQKLSLVEQKTYLWAHLTMDIVEEQAYNTYDVERICAELPTSVDEAYEKILAKSKDKEKTRRIFQIILAAKRPFTTQEMGVLLALRKDTTSLNRLPHSLRTERAFRIALRDACGLFVVIVDSYVYLLHQTAREFLLFDQFSEGSSSQNSQDTSAHDLFASGTWSHSFHLHQCHETLAIISAWFFRIKEMSDLLPELFIYCKSNFTFHVDRSQLGHRYGQELREILGFCDPQRPSTRQWLSDYWETHLANRKCLAHRSLQVTTNDLVEALSEQPSLSFPAFLGISGLVRFALDAQNPKENHTDSLFQALCWAAFGSSLNVVDLLLCRGANPNILAGEDTSREMSDDEGVVASPAHGLRQRWNALFGISITDPIQQPTAGTIRQRRTRALRPLWFNRIRDPWLARLSPLHISALLGNPQVTALLLSRGADAHAVDYDGDTPLHHAAREANLVVIKLLLQHKADRNAHNDNGQTPLMAYISLSDSVPSRLPGSHRLQDSRRIRESITKLLSTT